MERLGEPPTAEKLKSFDLLASVDMLRFDIQRFGEVLPETRQRVYDEELSLMAEGVERASRTSFTLQRQDDELAYFDNGDWRPYTGMLTTGLQVARSEAVADPRRQFLLGWAERDLEMGYKMQGLEPGQQLVWHNGYPFEVEQRYGTKFLQDCGLFPERQMGFIYRAVCEDDGSIRLESQTVDKSDPDALAAVEQTAQQDAESDMETFVRAYDDTLSKKHGAQFYAGRSNAEMHENAWEEIVRHRDLVSYFLNELEVLAASELSRSELETQVKRHVIGSWKAFKTRLDRKMQPLAPEMDSPADMIHPIGHIAFAQERLAMEVQASFEIARRNGEVKTGCGGSISADDDLHSIDGRSTFDAIFGTKNPEAEENQSNEEDEYGPLEFACTKGCKNKRPRGRLIDECKNKKHGCKGSVGC
jgi:hypothetical protein